jgi:hypothetical protein
MLHKKRDCELRSTCMRANEARRSALKALSLLFIGSTKLSLLLITTWLTDLATTCNRVYQRS